MTSLKDYTTFGVDGQCQELIRVHNAENVIQEFTSPTLILGGGSNLLFTKDYDGLIIKNEIQHREIIFEDSDEVYIKIGGGENWHDIVLWCIQNGYGGVENLSLIPGSVGAAPIQNIGAYGVELKDVFHSLDGVHVGSTSISTFSHEECQFGYRSSIFKNELKNEFFVTHVTLRLTKDNHKLNRNYDQLSSYMETHQLDASAIADISKAVIDIRSQKLPDPAIVGNAGSFFKNPIITIENFILLRKILPDIQSYPVNEDSVKISAAFLIDSLGWKGIRKGDAGVYDKHALVLVNYGRATGADIWALAQEIKADVQLKYALQLEPEVNII